MKPFRATKSAKGFKTTLTGFKPCEMTTRVTWDNKGCTVSIQCGDVQFTTDFTQSHEYDRSNEKCPVCGCPTSVYLEELK